MRHFNLKDFERRWREGRETVTIYTYRYRMRTPLLEPETDASRFLHDLRSLLNDVHKLESGEVVKGLSVTNLINCLRHGCNVSLTCWSVPTTFHFAKSLFEASGCRISRGRGTRSYYGADKWSREYDVVHL